MGPQIPQIPEVALSPEQAARAGITTAVAGPGNIEVSLELLGEVRLNADRVVHVSPRVGGVVAEVMKSQGDHAAAGEVLAVLDSRELAAAKAACLAARERRTLAQSNFDREKGLWEKKISAAQDYLAAKQSLAEAGIEVRSAEQQLRALGLSSEDVKELRAEDSLTRYNLVSPLDGLVIEKPAALGESVSADTTVFIVADLSTVWADFSVYPKDLPAVHSGQDVTVPLAAGGAAVHGMIGYLGPIVEKETRTALARVVLPNGDGVWKPGQFVTAAAACGAEEVRVLIPKTAIQVVGGAPSVFIAEDNRFTAAPVTLGREGDTQVEIVHGLREGQTYAATGTFILKAELEKEAEE